MRIRLTPRSSDGTKRRQRAQGVVETARHPADLKAELRLRGGEPEDTIFRLDGVLIENPYHFRGARGTTAALNIDAFDRLIIKTSGLGAEIGNTVSGAVELAPTERGTAGTFLDTAVGSLAARVTAGGELPGSGSWIAAGRYSNLDLYRSFLDSDRVSLPEFADLYLRARQPLTSRVDVVAGVLGSSSGDETADGNGNPATRLEAQTWMTYAGFDSAPREGLTITARFARTGFRQSVKAFGDPPVIDNEDHAA